MSSERPFRYWSTAILRAVQHDEFDVTLEPGERESIQVAINGTPMFEGLAYPPESFELADEQFERHLTDEGRAVLREVADAIGGDGA